MGETFKDTPNERLYSQRIAEEPPFLGKHDFPERLRTKIWDATLQYIQPEAGGWFGGFVLPWSNEVVSRIWVDLLGVSRDRLNPSRTGADDLRHRILALSSIEFCDYIEICISIAPPYGITRLEAAINRHLSMEGSIHRVVNGHVVTSMTDLELEEVGVAMSTRESVRQLLETAARFLKGDNPNFGAAIQQSVTSVETVANVINGDSNKSLGKALSELQKSGVMIHPALRDGIGNLYGFTSDAPGIRHGKESKDQYVDEATARFIVVVCSAIVNYLLAQQSPHE